MQQGTNGSNLERTLRVLRRRWFWMPVCILLGAGAAYGVSKHEKTTYTATASLLFKGNEFSQEIAGLVSNVGAQAEQDNDLKLVEFGNAAAGTANVLGDGLTAREVSESMSISAQGESTFTGESSVVDVSASAQSPSMARQIANTYAEAVVKEQRADNARYFKSALAHVEKQLAVVPRAQRFSTVGLALQSRAESMRLLAELQYEGVRLSRPATTPTGPSSPETKRDTIVGGVLGLLVGVALVFLLEHIDRRIREPDELERLYGAPLLGVVPESGSASRLGKVAARGAALRGGDPETFSLILAHLRTRNVGRDLQTILIASAAPGDGTTTVALHLAEAAARSGARVLLLEMNFRRPALASRLGLRSGPGLSNVLTGLVAMTDATQGVDVVVPADHGSARGVRGLALLSSGDLHMANPGALAESDAVDDLLARAKEEYDFVVVDAPPLTAVSDAFPLLRKVDGVVVVGAIGRDRRDVAQRLRKVVEAGGVLLGVVANRADSAGPERLTYQPSAEANRPASADAHTNNGPPPESRTTVRT